MMYSYLWLQIEDCDASLCNAPQAIKHVNCLADTVKLRRHDAIANERILDMYKWEHEDHLTMIAYGDSADESVFLRIRHETSDYLSAFFHVICKHPVHYGAGFAQFAKYFSQRFGAKKWLLTYVEPGNAKCVDEHGWNEAGRQ